MKTTNRTRKTRLCVQVVFILLFGILTAVSSRAQLQPSSVAGIMVPPGFDAEVFATGLTLPGKLVLESTGDLLVGSNCGSCPVVRLSRESGLVIASSNALADPDGVAVDSQGRIFVAGGSVITIANSLDGGSDEIFRSGHSNLQDIAIDSNDRIVIIVLNGTVAEVTETDIDLLAALEGLGGRVSFDSNDRLFASTQEVDGSLVRIDGGVVTPVTTSPIDPNGIAFGPGGEFGRNIFVSESLIDQVREVNEVTGEIATFATGLGIGFGLAFDGAGSLFLSDRSLNPGRIIRIYPTTIFKDGFESGDE